jgi:hypothetical protein
MMPSVGSRRPVKSLKSVDFPLPLGLNVEKKGGKMRGRKSEIRSK